MSRKKSPTLSALSPRVAIALALTLVSLTGASAGVQLKRPDLVVRITGPATASPGQDIGPLIKVQARNNGTAAAPGTTGSLDPANGFMIDVVLSTDTNVPAGFAAFSANFSEDVLLQGGRISNTTDLAPAATQPYPNLQGGNGKIPTDTPAGAYHLCARIDAGNKVAESNEGNNVSCARIKITGAKKPDLIVRVAAPDTARSGTDIGASVKLMALNVGGGPAPGTSGPLDPANGYMIDLVLSTDSNVPPGFATFSANFSEDVLLQGGRTSVTVDLAPGANKTYATGAGIPADTPTGSYQLCARIDPGSKVAESNESNNVMCRTIKIVHP